MLMLAAWLATEPALAREAAAAEGETSLAAPDATRKKRALVIGNAAYRSLTPLDNPVNDARDVCAALGRIGFKTTCLYNLSTRRELREAIRFFFSAEAGSGAETFFFYAGHGVQHRGENYLIPTEAQIWTEADIDFEGVGLSYLMQSVERARSGPNVIVLDACRDSPFRSVEGLRVESGLARVDPPVGTILVYATSPNKAAIDGSGRNGLFTKHLLAHVAEVGLQVDEMFRRVAKAVEDEAQRVYGYVQVPYRSSSHSGSYCLTTCDDPKVVEQMKAIEAQRNDLNMRLERMTEENERLRAHARSTAEEIARLEQRITGLTRRSDADGQQRVDVARELEQARAELAAVKAEQARRSALELDNQRRIQELEGLRAELHRQAVEIDEYRRRLRELEVARERRAVEAGSKQPPQDATKPRVIVPSF